MAGLGYVHQQGTQDVDRNTYCGMGRQGDERLDLLLGREWGESKCMSADGRDKIGAIVEMSLVMGGGHGQKWVSMLSVVAEYYLVYILYRHNTYRS